MQSSIGWKLYFCMILGTIYDENMFGRHCDIFIYD